MLAPPFRYYNDCAGDKGSAVSDKNQTEKQCPLCGQDNQCAVAAGDPPETCWCFSAQLDTGAKEKAAAITAAQCVCPSCGLPTGEAAL